MRYDLKKIYNLISENDQESLSISQIVTMHPDKLAHYLSTLKHQNPESYGKLLVRAFTDTNAKRNIINLFSKKV